MEQGFYRVQRAIRWGGYAHQGSGGFFSSGVTEVKDFDGKIGYLDERMVKLRDPKRKNMVDSVNIGGFYSGVIGVRGAFGPQVTLSYSIPLIFRGELLRQEEGFVVSFFKEGEIESITEKEALKTLGPMLHRRYGDLAIFPISPERKRDNGELWNPFEKMNVPCLENIPIYAAYTDREEIEKMIGEDKKLGKELWENERKRARSWSELRDKVVGAEGHG